VGLGFNVSNLYKIEGFIYKPRDIVKYEFRQLLGKIVIEQFKVKISVISYEGFQTKVYKLVAVIVYARLERKKLVLCENSNSLISLRSRYYVLRR